MGPSDLQPRRDLTLTHATSLVVGITIGTGIFLKSAAMAQAVGTPALVLAAWVAAGVVAMFGALCFAELGALLPEAGGEYVYLRAAFGDIPGFLYDCNSFVLGGASIAAYGAAVAIFVSDIHTFDKQWFAYTLHLFGADYSWQFGTRQLIAIGVIGVFAAINCAGVMVGGRVQTLLAVAKVAAIIAVAGGTFAFSDVHDWSNLAAPTGSTSGGLGVDLPDLHRRLPQRHHPRAGARLLRRGARRAVLRRLRALEPAHARAAHLAGATVHLGRAAGGLGHLRSAHQHGGDVVRAV